MLRIAELKKEEAMRMKRTNRIWITLFFTPFLASLVLVAPVPAENPEVPEAVKHLVGTYSGSWTMYGVDDKGGVVEKMKWTDVMEAKDPQIKDGRAFVSTLDKMEFGGGVPTQQMAGTEGYFLQKDGSLGDYYFENHGQVVKMTRIGEKTWVYTMPAHAGRLAFLGFQNVVAGRHVLVKEITEEEGMECHRISRLTTVNWKDQEGRSRWLQFVSLQGVHRRALAPETNKQ